jgi:NAD(P)-dependent dehydrogenase (short-subunit alcohol dehydrogenase family)
MDFTDKVCIVTGGANGIGRCIAEAFLSRGANAAVIDTDDASGNKLKRVYGGRLLFMQGDVSEKDALERFAQSVIQTFGHVDCLIHNACFSRRGLISGCGYEDFDAVLRAGVLAPYYLTCLFQEYFAPGAAIVNIASTRAFMSQPDTESYTAAKGGIAALTHAMAASLAGRVRVNAVSPGWIETGAYQREKGVVPQHSAADKAQHPAGRVGSPEDITNTVLFLCSDEAGFITGQNIVVDGGMSRQMIYHGDCGWTYQP